MPPTALDRLFTQPEAAHPDETGLTGLFDNEEAFAARVLSAQAAGRSLDLMYYIWETDLTGWLLLRDLQAAADRGVSGGGGRQVGGPALPAPRQWLNS